MKRKSILYYIQREPTHSSDKLDDRLCSTLTKLPIRTPIEEEEIKILTSNAPKVTNYICTGKSKHI